MSRISKSFRRVLIHPSSKPVWTSSFACIDGLPQCPRNLSLPAWANLIYGKHCHVKVFHAVSNRTSTDERDSDML